ncbi:MAG: Holliday junction branch migration protein RuvA [Candidatus Onthovivens sp.]
MYYALFGEVIAIFEDRIALLLESGIAFLIYISDSRKFQLDEKIRLYILDIFKDDLMKLYGFKDLKELEIFKELIEINGIGPKTGMQILRNIDVNTLILLINQGEVQKLRKISGIGIKADRIVCELKNKFVGKEIVIPHYEEVFDILLKLGYKSVKIREVLSSFQDLSNTSEIVLEAIKKLKDE